jgi:hypothetical protein
MALKRSLGSNLDRNAKVKMRSENPLLGLIWAQVDKQFQRFVLRRAIETGSRQREPLVEGWSFATDYAFAIEDAIRECVDLLMQAAIAGRRALTEKDSATILKAAVGSADEWKSWDSAGTFVAIAIGVKDPESVPLATRKAFLAELEAFEAAWQIEARNHISLRSALSSRTLPPRLKLNETQMQIALIKQKYPDLSQRKICAKLDAYNDRSKMPLPSPRTGKKLVFVSGVFVNLIWPTLILSFGPP